MRGISKQQSNAVSYIHLNTLFTLKWSPVNIVPCRGQIQSLWEWEIEWKEIYYIIIHVNDTGPNLVACLLGLWLKGLMTCPPSSGSGEVEGKWASKTSWIHVLAPTTLHTKTCSFVHTSFLPKYTIYVITHGLTVNPQANYKQLYDKSTCR